ncbi:ESPR-type extended signal peptide-containing protein [Haemophilus sp. SZY H8]|uniref:ESPR-type extended signal peptide-containing protein n=1 Tax=Haemophilus sp. SZY H8 TaxID=2839031 RepID=UPI001C048013|nr:ESPR-type extended signal peptide-containing protein [Haemophilus sp. SZY H8]
MNQIFRVVWNHSTQSWVAVSELTKAHKKASSSNTIKTFLGATALLFSLNGVEAAVNIESTSGSNVNSGSTKASGNSIAIGSKANALGGDEIVIGRGAGRTENNGSLYGSDLTNSGFNISIGTNSRVGEKGKKVSQSVAIGGGNGSSENKPDGAWARGTQSVAIGGNAYAYGDSSIAIGGDDVDEAVTKEITYTNPKNDQSKKATIKDAFTDLTGKNILSPRWTPTQASDAAVAVGMKATAAELGVSMGTLATASKVNAVAIGSGATANRDNSVALGGGSITDKVGTKQTQTVVNGITYSWAGGADTAEGDIVSVGSAGFERQIKNVAAGEVSNVSTDAINGSQLYGVLSNLTTGAFLNYAGDNAVQPNVDDTKVIKQSIANNRLDIRGGADKAALTNENIGVNNEDGKLWVKLAKDLKGLNSTTVGGIVTNASGIDMSNKPITNLAAGTNSTDAVNKSQLDKVANNNIKLGGDSGNTDAQQLDKTGGLQFNVKGTNGLTTTASGTDVTVKLDDATKAAVDSIANKIENNKIKLSATNDSTSTDQQDLNKSGGIEFKVKGDNGLTASASGDTVTLKLDDATKAKVDSVDSKIGDNNISLGSDSGSTDTQALTNAGGMKFNIKGENGLTTTASGKDVTVKLDDATKDKIDNAADKNLSNITDAGKKQIKDQVTWKAKANNSGIALTEDTIDDDDTAETIGADGILTLDAGKNLRLQRKGKVFTYGLDSDLTGINSITGLASTLPVTKNDAAAPTTNQAAPTKVDGTKAASVNDILNAGWNLKENDTDKDFVKAYDTVKFVNGTGTTANVTVTDNGAVSAVKFDVKKTTIAEDIAKPGTMKAGDAGDSFATANDVANAINSAFWTVTSENDGGVLEGNKTEEKVKAGDKVTFKAGENIKLKQDGKSFTYSLNPVLSNITSIGGNGTTMTFNPEGVDLGSKKITGLAPGEAPTDAVNKSQLDKVATNKIKLAGNSGETEEQQLDKDGGLQFNIKGENGLTTTASGKDVTVKLDDTTKDKIDNAADKNLSNITDAGKKQIKDQVTWKAKANNSGIDLDDDTVDDDDTAETIGADGILTLDAGKNLRLQRKGKVFTYGLDSDLTGINSITGLASTLPVTKNDAAAPTTNQAAPTKVDGTKAASVNDILNAGWNLKENNTDKDFVKAYDTVKFVNGTGTTANVTVTENGAVSAVKFDVKKTTLTADADKGTVSAGNAGDSFATANDVATAINSAFWNATSAKTINGEVSGTKVQPVKAGDTVTFEADKNIKLTQADGKFTFATKDDVEFNTVKVGGKEDGKSPVEFKTEKAKPASNNGDNNPTTALNVSSADGKPTQITGVASSLNKAPVTTAPNGKDGAKPESNLVDLANATTPNAVATVGDLQNMGWIVGAPENGYVDTVKNANKVDFKAGSGVSVTGKTVNGIREITIAVKEGEVVKDGDLTAVVNGESTPVTKVGDKYYKTSDIDPKTGKPVDEKVSPVTPDEGTTPIANAGDGYVTGNKVATAIQKSGFVVGKQTETLLDADFKNEDEKVNPNDELRFADGKNTKVKLATKDTVDREGNKVTTTTVKFDVDTGTVTSNKDGSVSGPVTPDMKKALDDAKKALADATTPEAKKTAQDKIDAVQANINNAGNQIATAQGVADAINKSGFTLTTSENGGKKLSGDDEIINPGKKVDLAAGKNMTVKQDAEGKVTYATADEVNFSSVQFGDNGPKINAAGDNINIGDKDGNPTKITGVKAGDISPTSTDAVNGAQIYALSRGNVPNVKNITDAAGNTYNNVIVDENGTPILKTYNVQGQKEIITNSVVEAVHNMNEQGIKFFHSNDGVDRPKVETENTFDSSASGKFATAIGSRSKADGTNAVAIGFNSVVTGNDSISIGTGNRVTGNNSGAFGDPSTVSGQGSYSVGNNNTVSTNDTFVLGNEVKHTVENSVILGAKSTATAGDGSRTASLYNIKQDGTKGTSTTAGSVGTVTTATVGNMTYGGFQGAKANGVVSVGASGDERRIQNVAAGEISSTSTDAINGSQLYSVAKGMGNRINHLQGQVNKLGKRMNAGVAGAMAAANLMQPHKPGQSAAMAAVGQHRGEAALAVGYSRISDNGKYGIKLSMGADTQGQVSTGAGVSYFW